MSPPTLLFKASLCVIIPNGVDKIKTEDFNEIEISFKPESEI